MIVDSIENGPYVRRMIATPGEPDLPVPVLESLHEQTDEELTETDIKRMDADDQAIQTILLGLPKDVYAAVDSFRQTKNLYETDFTQIYDFLKMNQEEVNELRVERLAKSHDPLALMAHSENSFNFPTTHKDQSSSSTHPQQSFPINNKYNPQPPLNQNFMQLPMKCLEDINDPTEAMNAILILFAKAFQLSAPTNNNQRTSSNPRNRQIAQPVINMGIANQSGTGNVIAARAEGTGNGNQARCYNCRGLGHIARNYTTIPKRRDAAYLQTQLLIAQKEEAGIQLQAEEFDFMAAAGDLDEIEEVNANCILMVNLQQASTSDGLAEVQLNDNCYDNEIFNMFTQEEQHTDLLKPIPEPQLVPQNDNHVTSVAPSMVQSGGTVETSFAPNEETRAHQETVYRNLVEQVAQKDKFLDKEVDLEARIKDLKNILLKMDQTVQTMHMLNPKPDSFYHPNQKMALGYPNLSYLKKAKLKQQSLYNGKLLLEEHDPPVVYDSEETLELAQESREKMRLLKKEIKTANYAKINHLSGFLNEVKSSLVTLQRVVKQKMTLEVHNWSSSADKEVHRIISHEIAPIINQVDDRVQNFKIQFLQEAAKFVRDFKSLAKEADESLDKQKSLELEIERLLKASVSHDIKPNGKMIVDSIENGPYVRRMIATPGEPDLPVPVLESFHEQTDEELTETDIKRMDADDQAIQTILLGLPKDVYAAVDSCETAKEI
nr:hypothetical protein [Tanacetum cinerariifolium]